MSKTIPEIGDWWQYNGVRVYICGKTSHGLLVCEYKNGNTLKMKQGENWKHLPGCDSFEWQEPKSINVDPGEGWRWLEDDERIHEGDQFFRPKYAEFLPVAGSVGHEAKCLRENGNPIRRRIAPAQPSNHTSCTIDASGRHQLKEQKKTVTFHEVVTFNTYFGHEIRWVSNPVDNVCTGRTRTEVVE